MHPHTMSEWVVFFLGFRQVLWEEPLSMGKPNLKKLILINVLNLLSSEKVCEGNVSLLPFFVEKAETPVMIKHDMNLLRNVTIPV